MSEQDNIDRVRDIIEKVGVCMLITQFAGGLRAPLSAAGLVEFTIEVLSAEAREAAKQRFAAGGVAAEAVPGGLCAIRGASPCACSARVRVGSKPKQKSASDP